MIWALLITLTILLIVYTGYSTGTPAPLDCKTLEVIIIDSGRPGPCLGIIAGVHGNEPAGPHTLAKMLKAGELEPRRGKLIIIPRANICGLTQNTRNDPATNNDINRQFTEHGGKDQLSEQILSAFTGCDLIIDFHEGWGWNLETRHKQNTGYFMQPISIGSTITPSEHPLTQRLAPKIIDNLNTHIADPLRRFAILRDSCDIPTTLACAVEKKGGAHILVETTGQKNIQPLAVREGQIRNILNTVFSELRM